MINAEDIVKRLLENEDEDDAELLRDILHPGELEPPAEADLAKGSVERFDRWADITIGPYTFCISYLTPVAVYIPGQGVVLTDRHWSASTCRHISKWAKRCGYVEDTARWAAIEERFPTMPQPELIELFRREANKVRWTRSQSRMAARVPGIANGLRNDRDEQISLDPYQEPR